MSKHFDLAECKLLTKILIASDFAIEDICTLYCATYSSKEYYFNWRGTIGSWLEIFAVPVDWTATETVDRIVIWEGVISS